MKNLVKIVLSTTLLVLLFTSCQKDGVNTNLIEQQEVRDNLEDNLLEKTIIAHPSKAHIETMGIPTDKDLFTTQIATPKELETKAQARSSFSIDWLVLCGDTITGNNQYASNNFNGGFYQTQGCLGANYGATGGDASILLWVEEFGSYDITLDKLAKDMDLFLFSLDANGDIDQCLGYSLSGGNSNEFINAELDLGTYAIIVDAYKPGEISNFELVVNCATVYNMTFCDDYELWQTDGISSQAYDWVKYSSGQGDAVVTNAKANYGKQSLYFDNNMSVVHKLGKEYHSGVHHLSWSSFIPTGKSKAFIFEKYNNHGKEQCIRVFLYPSGSIGIISKGQVFSSPYTYTQNQWIDIQVYYSLNSGQSTLWIDGNPVVNFCSSLQSDKHQAGPQRLAGISFFAPYSNTEFYIDDFCRTHTNPLIEYPNFTGQTLDIHPDF